MVTENKDAIGQKWDTGKAPVFQGFIKYFPRAIAAVAMVSQAGSTKYAGGKFPTKWREVPDGQNRYSDGMVRHMLEEAKGNLIDDGAGGTNCLHLAQEAWNNLARLELFLQEQEQLKQQTVTDTNSTAEPMNVRPKNFHTIGWVIRGEDRRKLRYTVTFEQRRGERRRG